MHPSRKEKTLEILGNYICNVYYLFSYLGLCKLLCNDKQFLFLFAFSIYEKLIQFCNIDEQGTNYPPVSMKQCQISSFMASILKKSINTFLLV